MRTTIATLAALAALTAAPAAAHAAWTPEPASYGVGESANVPVTMGDGTILRANVYYPTDAKTGKAAAGPFPTIMVQTPYGKDTVGMSSGQTGGPEAGEEAGPVPYLVQRGYIDVVADIRGQGDSEGTYGLFDPVQQTDGATLVRWAAKLPHASGAVGLYGPSYMGIDQFLTANALGPGSPLKALFPIVPGNDLYRDTAFDGGLPDAEFDAIILGLFEGAGMANPAVQAFDTDPLYQAQVGLGHAASLLSYGASQALSVEAGGDQSYDEDYWMARNPVTMLRHVADLGIPAYLVGGWFDLFQRGEPLDYSGLQNAYAGRSVTAPMLPDQGTTGRYQLLQGPWYHVTAGTGVDIYKIELAWFDRWLKGEDTGIDRVSRPLHVYDLSGHWTNTTSYPLDATTATTYYLGAGRTGSAASTNDGALGTKPPADATGADPVAFAGLTSPCDRQTEQWSAGALALGLQTASLPPDPCASDDRTLQTGPGALTYTTAPFTQATTIGGPIDATIYATSTAADTELVATLEDVDPSGASMPLTSGALLGSFRALDQGRTWFAPDGRPLLPYHPYTRASVQAVPAGQVTRFDIEVPPTLATIAPGHRLRLTLTTSDTPHLAPTPLQLPQLLGGVYEVQRNAHAASFVEIPTAPASAFGDHCAPDSACAMTGPVVKSARVAHHRRHRAKRHHRRHRRVRRGTRRSHARASHPRHARRRAARPRR